MALAGFLIAALVWSAPQVAAQGLEALGQPGVHLLMRHALAPGTGDPAAFQLDDCSTQRNLDDAGRAQAAAIGAALKARGVDFSRVLTSQWCRCRDTAALLDLGQPEDFPALNSFFRDRSKSEAQTQEIRDFLASQQAQAPLLLVTHQVNITALTGEGVSSGEVFVISVDPEGQVEVLERLLIRP